MIVTSYANNILNCIFGRTNNVAILTSCYIGLSTTTPENDGSNFTEPDSDNGYARSYLGNTSSGSSHIMNAASEQNIKNGSIIFFPEATSGWGTITHFGLFSAKTGGTPVFWGELTASVAVPTGYIPIFRAGSLSVSLT